MALASGQLAAGAAFAKTHRAGQTPIRPHHRLFAQPHSGERQIHLVNAHTNEALNAVYWRDGRYLPDALHQVNRVMRDHMSGDVHVMDPQLIDLLNDLRRNVGAGQPFQLISGYRSPRTNAWLHRTRPGVAANSLHVQGKAADIYLADCSLERLHNIALAMARGGVGYYPDSGFVHVDTGKVRQWEFG